MTTVRRRAGVMDGFGDIDDEPLSVEEYGTRRVLVGGLFRAVSCLVRRSKSSAWGYIKIV